MDWHLVQFYAHMGWPIFPCSAQTKAPLTPHGFKDATVDMPTLKASHEQHPGCAWGVATSAERCVVDIDPRHGGDATLAALVATHGPVPPTPSARTGGGGWHHYVRTPPGTRCGVIGPGIDRKAEGGYVILPPSRIECPEHGGRGYAWEAKPWEVPMADAPAWVLGAGPKAKTKTGATAVLQADPWLVQPAGDDLLTHPGAVAGERQQTLCRLVGVHLSRGDSVASVRAMAEAWVARSEPYAPDPDWWQKHVAGLVAKQGATTGRLTTHLPPPPLRAIAITEVLGDSMTPPANQLTISPVAGADGTELVGWLAGADAPADAERGGGETGLSPDWPTLPPDAYHGLLGDMLRAITPETEADPAGVLLGWLTCFGSVVGRGAWVQVGADRHHAALYVAVVGRTSDSKGVSWGVAKWPFLKADPDWQRCISHGVGSGQGLVELVRDERRSLKVGRDGTVKETLIPAAADKRCLIRLDEMAVCFKLQRGESSTLGETLLTAWGFEPLAIPNRGDNALAASEYAISVIGDTQPGTLHKLLEQGVEGVNGWLNRFLWCVPRSTRDLPHGGDITVLGPFVGRLAEALDFAKQAGEIRRDAEADTLWEGVYGELKRSGDGVPHTDRARPQVVRLSLLYALADRSPVVTVAHLRAALAVWDYCRASAAMAFGGRAAPAAPATPDPLWLRLLNAIQAEPGAKRSDLTYRLKHAADAAAVAASLAALAGRGLAHCRDVKHPKGGPPAECWWPGPGSLPVDNTTPAPPLSPDADADAWVVRADAARQPTNPPSAADDAWFARADAGRNQLTPAPSRAESELVGWLADADAGELVTYLLAPTPPPDAKGVGKVSTIEPAPDVGIPTSPPAWGGSGQGEGGVVNHQPDASTIRKVYCAHSPVALTYEASGGVGAGGETDYGEWEHRLVNEPGFDWLAAADDA